MNKQQLANRIWASANKMRSKIDANEYKDYILGLIFYKFLSDTEIKYLKEKMDFTDEDLPAVVEHFEDLPKEFEGYTASDVQKQVQECQRNIGFFIEYKYLFRTWLESRDFSVATLSDALKNFDRLMSDNYKSVYSGIFKTLSEGLSKLGDNPSSQTKALKELIKLIKDIPTDGSQDYDVLGYVYEFLIGNFAANAGKKAGEFYTPHEVAMVMSEIVAEHHKNKKSLEIYDPTSGSGSLLITIGKAVSKHITGKNKVKYFAQELKENTYNLTRMNLVMRGILPSNIVTRCADTLEEDWPIHEEGTEIDMPLAVDAVVSNPPYSQHWDPTDMEYDARFKEYGVAPKTKADYAFLLHELHHIKPDGILTIVLPHGVLFRGKAPKIFDKDGNLLPNELQEAGQLEGLIRANLIEKNNIDAIIGLPENIFFGTQIPTLIMVLKKNRGNEGVLIIDASKGYKKAGKQNVLRASDVKRIADAYRLRKPIPGFCREVSRDEIRKNDYNLNIPRYVDSSEAPVKYDIYSTMFGGIPNSEIVDEQKYWDAFSSLQTELFVSESDRPYSALKTQDVELTVNGNKDVANFVQNYKQAFDSFRSMLKMRLIDHVEDVHEVETLDEIAEDIFKRLDGTPLVDQYAAYQVLADHWPSIMGDVEIIQTEGYKACNVVEDNYKVVKKDGVEEEVLDGQKGRVIPFELVQQVRFQDEIGAISQLESRIEAIDGEVDTIRDEFTTEEQETYLDSEKDNAYDKNKIKADAKPKAVVEEETKEKLQKIVALWDEQAKAKKTLKTAKDELEKKTISTIEGLSQKEINDFLILKWIEPMVGAIEELPNDVVKTLIDQVTALAEKYAVTYNSIENDLKTSEATLADLIGQLTGDAFAIEGLNNLIKG